MTPKVSLIIVNYQSRAYTNRLIRSFKTSRFTNYEVIVVNNDIVNIGYGPAVNQAARTALGRYLFITNPDTLGFPDTLGRLVNFLDRHPRVGLVAPLLLDSHHRPYPLQGTRRLTPLSAVFALSFINKYWPSNPVSRWYWLADWAKTTPRAVDVAPGTAFLIRRRAFLDIGGFDPRFFLYFEESDLCRRLQSAGWQIYIQPAARLIHYWGSSTSPTPRIRQIFAASRRYYFQKHFGRLASALVDLVVK